MRLRSIEPSAAICCKLCLMLAADHIPNCLQSNKPETAFSSPTGTSFNSSLDMDIHAKCLLAIIIHRPNQPNIRTECRQKFQLPLTLHGIWPSRLQGPDAPAVSIRSRTAVRHLNSERTNRTET